MLTNAFIGREKEPTRQALTRALGPAQAAWDELLAALRRECGVDGHEWKSYSPKAGWSLRVKCKKRTIVWLSPSERAMIATFILGEKAMQAARDSGFNQEFLARLDKAPRYPEGTGVRVEVRDSADLEIPLKLARIKMEH